MKKCALFFFMALLLGLGGCGTDPSATPAPTAVPTALPEPTSTTQLIETSTPLLPPTEEMAATEEATPTATASPLPSLPAAAALGDSWVRPLDGMVMVYVPAGSFEMGSNDPFYNNERPPHGVEVAAFWLDRTEVTNGRYQKCVDAGVCRPPQEEGSFDRSVYYNDEAYDDYPVIHVDWYRAAAYCNWVGGKLPTEAQWEYAARGPENRRYPWGDGPDGTRLNYCDANCPLEHADPTNDDGYLDTAPVGTYASGASWCGALDLVGNVWEWVWDWYGFYPSEEHPAWLASDMTDRVIRGGAWDTSGDHARCTFRNWFNPAKSHDSIGFRCAIPASP